MNLPHIFEWVLFHNPLQGAVIPIACTLRVEAIGMFGDGFLAQGLHLQSPEVFSWDKDLVLCRPVKFFHTD